MICPVCHKDALIVEYQDIELDYCTICGGVWFDAGELELLIEAAGLGDLRSYLESIVNAPEAASPEKKHKCPDCQQKMKKIYIDEDNKILVDVCHVGDGIWLDGGEINHLVKALAEKSLAKDASQDILSFVGEMFKYQAK